MTQTTQPPRIRKDGAAYAKSGRKPRFRQPANNVLQADSGQAAQKLNQRRKPAAAENSVRCFKKG